MLPKRSLRNASRDLGDQLLSLGQSWDWCAETLDALLASSDDQEWHHAPVFGMLAAAAKATPREALAVYLHQAALGCIGAGVRAIPIGHTHGQQILTRLHDDLESLSATFADCNLETAGSFSPAYEVLCHVQSHLYTRLFRS